jgi:hypothetical protein
MQDSQIFATTKAGERKTKIRMRYTNSSGEGLRFEEEEVYVKWQRSLGTKL